MTGSEMLDMLKIFLVILGVVSAAWGVYNLFGDSGAQNGIAWAKIFGGIAFAVIIGITLSSASKDIKEQENKVNSGNLVINQQINLQNNIINKGIYYGG